MYKLLLSSMSGFNDDMDVVDHNELQKCIDDELSKYTHVITRGFKKLLVPELQQKCIDTIHTEMADYEMESLIDDFTSRAAINTRIDNCPADITKQAGDIIEQNLVDAPDTIIALLDSMHIDGQSGTDKTNKRKPKVVSKKPTVVKTKVVKPELPPGKQTDEINHNEIPPDEQEEDDKYKASSYIYLLLGIAIKDLPTLGIEVIKRILDNCVKILNILSNNEGCLEMMLKELIGKRLSSFINYYIIGEIVLKQDPSIVLHTLRECLVFLLPYVKSTFGFLITSIFGYLFSIYSLHYGKIVNAHIGSNISALLTQLEALERNEQGTIEQINSSINSVINSISQSHEMYNDAANLKSIILENLANDPQDNIGNFENVLNIQGLKELLKNKVVDKLRQSGSNKVNKNKNKNKKNASNKVNKNKNKNKKNASNKLNKNKKNASNKINKNKTKNKTKKSH